MADAVREEVTTGLFIGMPIPEETRLALRAALRQYPQHIEKKVVEESWHLTLQFVGEVKQSKTKMASLMAPMPQAFLPTVNLTHVGRGLTRDQMWAFAHQTPLLNNLRRQVRARLEELGWDTANKNSLEYQRQFVPHVNLARLYEAALGLGIADTAVALTFKAPRINIYQSEVSKQRSAYRILGEIELQQ